MNRKITPCIFTKRNEYGDFLWMSKQEKYKNALFIFNDNIEHMNDNMIVP